MSNPHINEPRTHLMATLADLRDRKNPMEPDRARAVAQVAGVLIESAKVENEYLKLSGQDRSEFLEAPAIDGPRLEMTMPAAHNPFPAPATRWADKQ
jgi:hypothetical protein